MTNRPTTRPSRPDRPLSSRAVLLLAAALTWIVPGSLAPVHAREAGDEQMFSGTTDVTVIEVPVQVVHRGDPVRDLTADDFRIFDEGEPREITSFERIDLRADAPRSAPEAGAGRQAGADHVSADAPAARRHFLLFFDLAFSRLEDLRRAERAARTLVREQLHPSDVVGVALHSPRRGASMVLRFTTDHAQVLGVLDALGRLLDGDAAEGAPATDRASVGERRSDPLRLTAGFSDAALADVGRAQGVHKLLAEEAREWAGPFDGIGGAYELNKINNMIWNQQQQMRARRGGDVADLSDSLASLARQTRGIPGPKYLVLFSRGFDVELLQAKSHDRGPSNGGENAWFAIGGASWILTEVNAMLDALREAGWAIHAIDMAGTTAGYNWNFREGLFFLADETGGALYESTNDPAVALGEMIERTAVTYLLTFQVDALPAEPLFRRLRVEVDGLPRRARVVHRAGYETPRPWTDLSPARRRAESAEALITGNDRDGLGLRVLALPCRAEQGGWSVPVALEIDGPSLLAGQAEHTPGAEIYAYAFDAEGGVVDLLAHRIDFRRPEARGRLMERGLKFLGDLSLPAGGSYRLRFLVRSLRNGETALHTVPLDLPRDDRRSVLLPPVLLEPEAGSWLVTTEIDERSAGHPRPFTLHGRSLTPAVGAVRLPEPGVQSTNPARILVLGYGLGGTDSRLRATLVGPDGEPAGEATFVARAPGEGLEPDLLIASLPDGLAPGAYRAEVALVDDDGTVRGRTATRFRIERGG